MEDITLEDLRAYRGLLEDIKAIEEQLRAVYVQSPPPREVVGGRSSVPTPGDPTARKAMEAIRIQEKLEKALREREIRRHQIEEYIEQLEDHHIAAIMRYHFIMGMTWAQTCLKIYGYADRDICRMAIHRYFEKGNREDKEKWES